MLDKLRVFDPARGRCPATQAGVAVHGEVDALVDSNGSSMRLARDAR